MIFVFCKGNDTSKSISHLYETIIEESFTIYMKLWITFWVKYMRPPAVCFFITKLATKRGEWTQMPTPHLPRTYLPVSFHERHFVHVEMILMYYICVGYGGNKC